MMRREMITRSLALVAFDAPSWAALPSSGKWDPLSGAGKFADWLESLQRKFDAIATHEERAQILRKIMKLRRGIYLLEFDSRTLKDSIPSERPDHSGFLQIQELIDQLRGALVEVRRMTRDVGSELGSSPPADAVLTYVEEGGRLRSQALDITDNMLRHAQMSAWRADTIRDALEKGIEGLHRAYVAADNLCAELSKRDGS